MKFLMIAAGVLSLSTSFVEQAAMGNTLIFVNYGSQRSADVTGHHEPQVNWTDRDLTDDTTCTESFAALELQHYLQKLTGRYDDFDTVKDDHAVTSDDLILVGGPQSNTALREYSSKLGLNLKAFGFTEPQLAKLGPEGFRIRSFRVNGRRITIVAGGGRVGTLYGAYELLRQLGCNWDQPGESSTDVPHRENLVDMDVAKQIPVALRPCPLQFDRKGSKVDFFIWMARNRFNKCYGVDGKDHLMHKLGIDGHTVLSRMDQQ